MATKSLGGEHIQHIQWTYALVEFGAFKVLHGNNLCRYSFCHTIFGQVSTYLQSTALTVIPSMSVAVGAVSWCIPIPLYRIKLSLTNIKQNWPNSLPPIHTKFIFTSFATAELWKLPSLLAKDLPWANTHLFFKEFRISEPWDHKPDRVHTLFWK